MVQLHVQKRKAFAHRGGPRPAAWAHAMVEHSFTVTVRISSTERALGEGAWHFDRTLTAHAHRPAHEDVGTMPFAERGLPMAPGERVIG